jgi:hypothetical protein
MPTEIAKKDADIRGKKDAEIREENRKATDNATPVFRG